MTREVIEAIEYIKTYRKLDENLHNNATKGSVSFYATEKCLHYWDMAIKALENEPRFLVHSDGKIEQIIEPCDDAVSRQAVLNYLTEQLNINEDRRSSENFTGHWREEEKYSYAVGILENFDEYIRALPSVLPKREQGEWIKGESWSEGCGMGETYGYYYECSKCGKSVRGDYNACGIKYCPNCGAEMR